MSNIWGTICSNINHTCIFRRSIFTISINYGYYIINLTYNTRAKNLPFDICFWGGKMQKMDTALRKFQRVLTVWYSLDCQINWLKIQTKCKCPQIGCHESNIVVCAVSRLHCLSRCTCLIMTTRRNARAPYITLCTIMVPRFVHSLLVPEVLQRARKSVSSNIYRGKRWNEVRFFPSYIV